MELKEILNKEFFEKGYTFFSVMVFMSVCTFFAAFYILRESVYAIQFNRSANPNVPQSFSSQGIKYKCFFLIALFIALLGIQTPIFCC